MLANNERNNCITNRKWWKISKNEEKVEKFSMTSMKLSNFSAEVFQQIDEYGHLKFRMLHLSFYHLQKFNSRNRNVRSLNFFKNENCTRCASIAWIEHKGYAKIEIWTTKLKKTYAYHKIDKRFYLIFFRFFFFLCICSRTCHWAFFANAVCCVCCVSLCCFFCIA